MSEFCVKNGIEVTEVLKQCWVSTKLLLKFSKNKMVVAWI